MARDRWSLTGGSGYVGRALAARLRDSGAHVRVLARDARPVQSGIDVIVGDVSDPVALDRLVRDCDIVVHLAAWVHRATRTSADRAACWTTNVGGTETLVGVLRKQGSRSFLVHVSSVSVYGPSEESLDETAPCRPQNDYAETKLAAERVVRELPAATSAGTVVLRPCMVFGPGAPGNLARVLSLARRGLFVQVGDGANRKSLLPVQTLVDAILHVGQRRAAAAGEILNVCGGAPMSISEIGRELARGLAAPPRVVSLPKTPLVSLARGVDALTRWLPFRVPELGQLVETYASSNVYSDERLRSHLGFLSTVDVRAALREMAAIMSRKG